MKRAFLVSATLLMLIGAGPAAAQTLLWSDEFDSGDQPDPRYWSYDLGTGTSVGLDPGWGNRELQTYTNSTDNVRIENGNLVITAVPETSGGSAFSSARIRSEDKITFKYATIEARIKMPDLANGLWPAFWTLGNNWRDVGWPNCGELDIVEMGFSQAINAGRVNRRVASASHWENNDQQADFSQFLDLPNDIDGEYHVYRMEWTPTVITTYIDDQQIWAFNIEPQNCTDCTEFHQPHFAILNLAVGGNLTQIFSADQITAPMPAEMMIDYVRIYDNGHTEVAGTGYQAGPLAIGPAHSGSWYNTEQSGHGFNVQAGQLSDGTPIVVVYWYIYDENGNPIFLGGSGFPDGNRVVIDLFSPVGMIYGDFTPVPGTSEPESGGTAVFEFSDQGNGTFSYTPSTFTEMMWGHTPIENLPIVKLLGIPAPDSYSNPQ